MNTPALHYLLEFTRVHAAEDTYAFRQGLETYIVRAAGGRHQGTRGKRAQLDWSDAGLQADLAALRGQGSAAAHTSHDERLQRLGGRLRRFLGEADWSCHEAEIEALLERARALDALVHITIRSDAAELYALPWELLVLEGSGQSLGEIDRVVVGYAWPGTRTVASTAALAAGSKRGRLLLAWSDAGGRVPSMAHIDALTRACAAGPLWFDPARDVLAQVSVSSLAQTLAHAAAAGEPYSALHVLCHGREDLGMCVLAWHHERGSSQPALLTAATVRRVIEPHTGELRLVTLCACHSSDVGAPGTHLGSITQGLHRIGVPWVVGSRSLLSKRGATDFAMVFYEALASGAAGEPAAGSAGMPAHGQETAHASVERAFARARRELALGHSDVGDWISMMLYARPEDRGLLIPASRFDAGVQTGAGPIDDWENRRQSKPSPGAGDLSITPGSAALEPTVSGHEARNHKRGPGTRSSSGHRTPTHKSSELCLRIQRRGDNVYSSYHRADSSLITSHVRAWNDIEQALVLIQQIYDYRHDELDTALSANIGHALFNVALGPERVWETVLRAVFHQGADTARPNPIFGPLRMRVQSTESAIVRAPWRLLCWQGRRLSQYGWRISNSDEIDNVRDHTTSAPANVLILTSEHEQIEALREVLGAAWGAEQQASYLQSIILAPGARIARVIRDAADTHHPDIIYVHFPADKSFSLDVQRLLVESLLTARHRPQVMYLDIGGHPSLQASVLGRKAELPPLTIWRQTAYRSRNADLVPLYWLRRWLCHGDDPVAALHTVMNEYFPHDLEAATLAVHSNYRSWRTAQRRASAEIGHASALHKLDRDSAKALTVKHIKELTRSDVVRVMALIGYAAPGNHLDALCSQLRFELEVEAYRDAALSWQRIEFPEDRTNLRADLESELVLQLGQAGSESLRQVLSSHASRAAGRSRRVLWLDCGVFGRHPDYNAPLRTKHLADWVCFASETLVAHCPADMRIVWYIAVETEQHEAMARTITKLFETYSHAGFRIDDLHIGHVTERHLLNYLREHGGCPQNIERELTERILAATGGLFDQTTAILDEARHGSWYALCERLRREQGAATSEPEEEFEF